MLLPEMFDLFKKPVFDETIQRVETRTYYPFIKSFGNNDIIEISINQGDSWLLMYDAALVISGVRTRTAGAGNVDFVNNAPAFFFDSISYEINGKEVESVRDPGIVSTIRGLLMYNEQDSVHLSPAGWNYPNTPHVNADGYFCMRVPLKHLFNIFNDYKMATCGKQTLRLVRARDDTNALRVTGAATTGTMRIDNIELKVQHIIPNDEIKMNLLQAIKSDRPMIIPFRKWVFHELPSLKDAATKENWRVKTCSSVESPRFVIVAFHTDRKNVISKDPTLFDHIDAMEVRLIMNGEYYPHERMRLDYTRNAYGEAHHNYTEFYPKYTNSTKKNTLLTYDGFKQRALYVIDCSRRSESLKSTTADIEVEIESKTAFPVNTRAYCIIIHDCLIEHLPLSEIVRNLM